MSLVVVNAPDTLYVLEFGKSGVGSRYLNLSWTKSCPRGPLSKRDNVRLLMTRFSYKHEPQGIRVRHRYFVVFIN